MTVPKKLSITSLYEFTGHHLLWLTAWVSSVTLMHQYTDWEINAFPWFPLPLIGTAVAFYVGFKNNQSYERLWEARKLWGEIAIASRMLVTMVLNYKSGEPGSSERSDDRRQIVLRHIAYLYQLRQQMLEPPEWDHVSLEGFWGKGYTSHRRDKLNKRFQQELDSIAIEQYLLTEECLMLKDYKNKALQLLNLQTQVIQQLFESKSINMVQQMEFQSSIRSFNESQGRMERIKQSPFPRKYATFSFIFVCVFIFMLPFGIVGELSKLGSVGVWFSIPVGVIIGWIFVAMEMIGDYSENPFDGLHTDVPMLYICREIEIDLLQALGISDIPDPIKPKAHVLI